MFWFSVGCVCVWGGGGTNDSSCVVGVDPMGP